MQYATCNITIKYVVSSSVPLAVRTQQQNVNTSARKCTIEYGSDVVVLLRVLRCSILNHCLNTCKRYLAHCSCCRSTAPTLFAPYRAAASLVYWVADDTDRSTVTNLVVIYM